MNDLSKDLPKGSPISGGGGNGTGKIVLGLAGIGAAGAAAYFIVKNVSSTLTSYGNEAQQMFSQCSSTITAQRADYIKYLNQYLTAGKGHLTGTQLANLKTIQTLMTNTAAQCSAELSNFCKQNPKQCPAAPIPTLVNGFNNAEMIAAAIAAAGVSAGLGAGIYKKMTKSLKKNPKASLTGSGNRGVIDNSVSEAKIGQGEVAPEDAANYASTMQDENVIVSEDLTSETEALNASVEETIITSAEEETIATTLDTEFQTTIDDFIALE